MDPKAALDAAEEALDSGDKADAREYLANYASWRRGGGFQPAGGDARHAALSKRLRSRKRVSKNSRKARLRRNADGGPNLLLLGGLALGGYLAYRWLTSGKAAARPVAAPAAAAKAPAAPALPMPPAMPAAPALPSVQMPVPAVPSLPAPESDWRMSATVEEMDAAAKSADPGKAASGIGNYYNDGE